MAQSILWLKQSKQRDLAVNTSCTIRLFSRRP